MAASMCLIAVVVAGYWSVAATMIFVNKAVIERSKEIDISILIVWFQNVSGLIVFLLLRKSPLQNLKNLKVAILFQAKYEMILAGVMHTAALVCNNLTLKTINISFYQIARSLTLVFVTLFSYLFLKEKITVRVAMSCLIIISGFFVGVDQELLSLNVRPIGVVYGATASFFAAWYGIFLKRLQVDRSVSSLEFTFYNYLICSIGLCPVVIQSCQLRNFWCSEHSSDRSFWTMVIISGVTSIGMVWTSTLQISLTSPLTHFMSVNAKSVLLTIIAVVWHGETRSSTWWLGNAIVIMGVGTYTWSKLSQMDKTWKRIVSRIAVYVEPKPEPLLDDECKNVDKSNNKMSTR